MLFTQEVTFYLAQYVTVGIVLQSCSHRREQLGFRALQGHFERIHQIQRVSKTNYVVEPFLVRKGRLFSRNYHAEGQELLDVAETTDLEEKEAQIETVFFGETVGTVQYINIQNSNIFSTRNVLENYHGYDTLKLKLNLLQSLSA